MTAPGYSPGDYGKAEQLAAEARSYLGQEEGKDAAAGIVPPAVPEPGLPGVGPLPGL
jgi:hypothetical protein